MSVCALSQVVVLLLLIWAAAPLQYPAAAAPPAPPNVLIITVDTLRSDYLGCYGGQKIATPNMDALAAGGVRFRTAVCQAPLTLPSHCSMFTGMYPLSTGVRDNLGYALTPDQLTLAEILRKQGYHTAAFVSAYVLHSKWGIAQGFELYDDFFKRGSERTSSEWAVERKGDATAQAAQRWLENSTGAPFFCWVHLFDPHDPYDAPEPFKSRYRDDPYGAEVAYTDQTIGRLLDSLKRSGKYKSTLIVLTGDHGESLGEHQEPNHGLFLYDSTLLVPLIFKLPGEPGTSRTVDGPIQLVDVAPTVLQAVGMPRPPHMQGHGRWSAILGRAESTAATPAYSETYYPNEFGWSELRCWRTGDFKFVLGPEPELYDLKSDPGENRNLARSNSALAEKYKAALHAFEARYSDPKAMRSAQTQLSAQDLERFRALGYIGGEAPRSGTAALLRPDPKQKITEYLLISKATTLIAQSRFREALVSLRALLQRDPSLLTAHSLAGQCHLQLQEYDQAQTAFEQVLREQPDRVYPLYYLGLSHFYRRQYDRAASLFENVARLDPRFFPAYNYLGLIYSDLGQTSKAIEALSSAVRLEENTRSLEMLGMLYAKEKMLDKAAETFRRVTTLEPENAMAHFHLAGIYALQGHNELARREYQTAVRLDPKIREQLKK